MIQLWAKESKQQFKSRIFQEIANLLNICIKC